MKFWFLAAAMVSLAWAEESGPKAAPANPEAQRRPWVDVSGYVAARRIVDSDVDKREFPREYVGSLFLSRAAGKWNFLSELQMHNLRGEAIDGLTIGPRRRGAQVQTAWANYNFRDSLQIRMGHQLVPTYWRLHRYQSTTLTVDDPLIDSKIFPASFDGAGAHGAVFGDRMGFSYSVYGGSGNRIRPVVEAGRFERTRAVGGTATVRFAPEFASDSLDIGWQQFTESFDSATRNGAKGLQLRAQRGRFALIGEAGRSRYSSGQDPKGLHREGHYLQPSFRIRSNLYAVYRHDRLRKELEEKLELYNAHTFGIVYRPKPGISLKLNYVRYAYREESWESFSGVTAAAVYFFRIR